MRAFMVAGTHSGVGKTVVSLCIVAALKKRGYRVQPFKVGPDFIDPTHYEFCGHAINLDSFMMGEEGVRGSFARWLRGKDVAVIEGVMGLFDGYKLSNLASSAHVAQILNVPVILVMDAKGLSRSALAMFEGYKNFDKKIKVIGAILNNCSEGMGRRMRGLFEERGYKIFGYFPQEEALKIESRHLGLHLGMEKERDWRRYAELGEKYVDIDAILEMSEVSVPIEEGVEEEKEAEGFTIGIPFDAAFAFYYKDNLRELRRFAKLVYFSPLKKEKEECDAYYLGGGYPELYPEELKGFCKFMRREAEEGKPIYGECGGMMFLARKITYEGGSFEMAGVLDVDVVFTKKLQALGYVKGEVVRRNPFFTGSFRGHEFHYSYALPDRDVRYAFKTDGKGIKEGMDGIFVYNTLAAYTHIHFFSAKLVIKDFL
ncbi:MAG: cobyrinate a,c-diamide synthase [Candidatus Methanospirareceae archaeon]